MHSRILAVFLPLVVATSVMLGVWLCWESGMRLNRESELDRNGRVMALNETLRAADIDRGSFAFTPNRYETVRGPELLLAGDDGPPLIEPLSPTTVVWPWTGGSWSADTTGGFELWTSTDAVQAAVMRRWTIIGMAVMTAAAGLVAAAYPLARWALRPMRELDVAARGLAAGQLDTRVHSRGGPPELALLAQAFNDMADQVEAALRRERAFVASASHHLGNLMTPLRLRIEVFEGSPEDVEELQFELDRLESVVERLLELHRAEEKESESTAIDVAAVVDAAMPTWFVAAEQLGISLRREGSTHAMARTSAPIVEEALDNLLDNAVKYSEGRPISVRVLRGIDNVRLVVADEGPGMDEAEIGLAQGRFWRGPEQQNRPGSGLGLAIVDALALRCGGHLELRLPPDGGLEATLVFERLHSGAETDADVVTARSTEVGSPTRQSTA